MCHTTIEVSMARRPKPSVPAYGASHRESVLRTREAMKEGCEICGIRKGLYVFTIKGKSKVRCSCHKHLKRIK